MDGKSGDDKADELTRVKSGQTWESDRNGLVRADGVNQEVDSRDNVMQMGMSDL